MRTGTNVAFLPSSLHSTFLALPCSLTSKAPPSAAPAARCTPPCAPAASAPAGRRPTRGLGPPARQSPAAAETPTATASAARCPAPVCVVAAAAAVGPPAPPPGPAPAAGRATSNRNRQPHRDRLLPQITMLDVAQPQPCPRDADRVTGCGRRRSGLQETWRRAGPCPTLSACQGRCIAVIRKRLRAHQWRRR